MNNQTIIVTEYAGYHHMPTGADWPNLKGLSIRQALKLLRTANFGDIGGMYDVLLSDGTYLGVELTKSKYSNTRQTGTQRAVRWEYADDNAERVIRYYPL